MKTKKKPRVEIGERQCLNCQTFKRAGNCIRCFNLERVQRCGAELQLAEHTRLIQDLREITETTPFMQLRDRIKERMNRPMAPAARPRQDDAQEKITGRRG